ncbi:MAG: ankyrin repeat domain-containing protein [Acidobacteria bacterium]|nr:ankyrin repeat domain-containing protein [Acidobacteriota bacterium]
MKQTRALAAILLFLLVSAPGLRAGDLDVFKTYVNSVSNEEAREAEVRQALEARPELANARDEEGPILQWALSSSDVEGDTGRKSRKLAELLIAKGANVNAPDGDGKPLIIRFALSAQKVPLEILVKARANVNVREEETGRTALHLIALIPEISTERNPDPSQVETLLETIRFLIRSGADVNARDAGGVTPLMSAAFLGNLKMAELLIAAKADVNAKDNEGYSILGMVLTRLEEDWASRDEKSLLPPVIELLKSKGARDERPKKE